MPKKKVENQLESKKDDNKSKLDQLNKEVNKVIDIKERAEKLSNMILRMLYTTYGSKDSHTNKHLYQHVMFEVASLSNKTIEEITRTWPKFDIFTISAKIKKIVEEELKSDPTIMYRMIINDRIIADRILAKAIVDSMAS